MEMVDDVIRLLDHLKIQKAHIVGYSMGGFITAALVATHPDSILSATMGGAGWSRPEDDHSVIEAVAKSLEAGTGITPLMKGADSAGCSATNRGADDVAEIGWSCWPTTRWHWRPASAGCSNYNPREALVNNKVPVLAICGDRDPLKKGSTRCRA